MNDGVFLILLGGIIVFLMLIISNLDGRWTMIIEYDNDNKCIRINGEYLPIREAEGIKDELKLAIDQWEVDHAPQCDNPDGHYDD